MILVRLWRLVTYRATRAYLTTPSYRTFQSTTPARQSAVDFASTYADRSEYR